MLIIYMYTEITFVFSDTHKRMHSTKHIIVHIDTNHDMHHVYVLPQSVIYRYFMEILVQFGSVLNFNVILNNVRQSIEFLKFL